MTAATIAAPASAEAERRAQIIAQERRLAAATGITARGPAEMDAKERALAREYALDDYR